MTKETMTVHRALAELKIIDDRITSSFNESYCVTNKHSNVKIKGIPLNEYKDKMRGNLQRTQDLIARRDEIKRAVVMSNANTNVNISEKMYTVAEAIELKNHSIPLKEMFLTNLKHQYALCQTDIEQKNGKILEEHANQYVSNIFIDKEKADTDAFELAHKNYVENNTYDFIDPNRISSVIDKLDNDIYMYIAEVDAALSTSNALTTIEIEY
ncbi:MAG: hypothetical protein RRZ64_06510 [Rikenellaceae bacterium]